MTIDKSWTTCRNRGSLQFINGLTDFIERCRRYSTSDGYAHCPCTRHDNRGEFPLSEIYSDVFKYGFSPSYTTWTFNGEEADPLEDDLLGLDEEAAQMNDLMDDYLEDIRWENTTNEPELDMGASTAGPSGTTDEFDELLKEAETELFPGCTWMSSLNFVAKMMHIKVLNKWSNTSFNQLLECLRFAMPKENKVPSSFYEAKKILKKVGLGYEAIQVCKNDCCLFWKENQDMQSCPTCNESRWKHKGNKNGNKVAQKVLRYFPLTPRLKRLYNSRHTAVSMTWHATGRCIEDGKMRHPVDATAWKDFDDRYPDFARETRNVRLGLAADGFNPYGNMSLSYSMWPVILTTYNLPPWLCMKETSFMLALLIPGPKSPGKDIDVFLRPLVDELKSLWSDGVRTRDAATNTVFTMRSMLLWTINDFPARGSLSGWGHQGYLACPNCSEDAHAVHLSGKMAYTGHRRWLHARHKYRKDRNFDGNFENRVRPRKFSSEYILETLAQLPASIPGKHPAFGGVKRKSRSENHNWTKRSIFFELEYWATLQLKHNLDVMHIEKNVCESLLNTLLMNEKSKDTNKAREGLKTLGIRKELWLQPQGGNKFVKPHLAYSFTTDGRRRFCEFIKNVKLPDGFGSIFTRKVTDNLSNVIRMKSHDYHVMLQRLLLVGVQGCLASDIATPIIELCSFFKQICARTLMARDMVRAEEQLIKVLAALNKYSRLLFFDIMIHLVIHLPEEAIQGGPVYMRWMYPFERYMKKLKNYVRNKARPEGSIAEGYIADEALTFCSRCLRDVHTRYNRPDRNEDDPTPKMLFHVFKSRCTPRSMTVSRQLDDKVKKMVEWYVLNNSPEIDQYKNEFVTLMPEANMRNEFPEWFKNKIFQLRVDDQPNCSDEILALASGSDLHAKFYTACTVNGVRFVVRSRETNRSTQNSGVSTVGIDNEPYYGQLEEIMELRYMLHHEVVLFRCKWFNTRSKRCVTNNNITSINISQEAYKNDQYILATQAKQVFYLEDPHRTQNWKVVQEVNNRKIWDRELVVEDVIHNDSSSDFVLSANLDDLAYTILHTAGQHTEVIIPDQPVRRAYDDAIDEDVESNNDDDDVEPSNDDVESDNAQHNTRYISSDESD